MYWHFGLRKAYQYIQVGMLPPPLTVKKKAVHTYELMVSASLPAASLLAASSALPWRLPSPKATSDANAAH